MSRLVLLLSFTALILFASCVNLSAPSKVSQCQQDNTCTDSSGGKGGATAGAGGRTADAGASDVSSGGRGGGTTGGSTGASGGATGGATGGRGGTGGTGGVTGGTSDSADAGTEPTPDAAIDKPFINPDVPIDALTKPDILPDTASVGPDVGPPEVGQDATWDLAPDRPDTTFEAPTCIQAFKSNGYALLSSTDGGLKSCSECKDRSGTSLEASCKLMIDCVAAAWVCKPAASPKCWTDCRNNTPGGDMVLDGDCVTVLVNKACP